MSKIQITNSINIVRPKNREMYVFATSPTGVRNAGNSWIQEGRTALKTRQKKLSKLANRRAYGEFALSRMRGMKLGLMRRAQKRRMTTSYRPGQLLHRLKGDCCWILTVKRVFQAGVHRVVPSNILFRHLSRGEKKKQSIFCARPMYEPLTIPVGNKTRFPDGSHRTCAVRWQPSECPCSITSFEPPGKRVAGGGTAFEKETRNTVFRGGNRF